MTPKAMRRARIFAISVYRQILVFGIFLAALPDKRYVSEGVLAVAFIVGVLSATFIAVLSEESLTSTSEASR